MSYNSTRLGDLLVEQQAISVQQLRQAIELQHERRIAVSFSGSANKNKSDNTKIELGEILIELGFISRHQLKTSLGWQRRLRKTTAVMVFIAPLLTAACGGGGGSSATSGGQAVNQGSSTQLAVNNSDKTTQQDSQNSSAAVTNPMVSAPESLSAIKSSANNMEQSSVMSMGASPLAPVASQSSDASSTSSSSVASSSMPSGVVNGPVQLFWSIPNQRENGDYLDVTEIGGYELRYRLKSDAIYEIVHIGNGYTDAYYFANLQGDYEFQIATFDKNGLYSAFITINPN